MPRLGVLGRVRAAWWGGLVLVGSSLGPARALAGPEEALRAESLFRSGKQAYQRGDYPTACPRLAESQRLEPAGGTLLALALCYEAWGKNATAWALFQQAEAVARTQGRSDRIAIARERAQALEPGLSFVTIQLAAEAPPNVEVALDGLRLGSAALGTETAVDAGRHRVEARDGSVVYFAHDIDLAAKGSVVVQIPAPPAQTTPTPTPVPTPRALPSPAPPSLAAPPGVPVESRTRTHAQRESLLARTAPFVALGMGASSLIVGGYFGLRAYRENGEVEQGCKREPCSTTLERVHESARRNASISTWLMAGGAVVTAGGVYWLLARRDDGDRTASELRIEVLPHAARATVSGTF